MSDGRSQDSSDARIHPVLRACMVFLLAVSSPAAIFAQDSSQNSDEEHSPPARGLHHLCCATFSYGSRMDVDG